MSQRIARRLEQAVVREYQRSPHGGRTLAAQFGIGATTLYRILKRNHIPVADQKRNGGLVHRERFTAEEAAAICAEYQLGTQSGEFLKRFGCDRQTLLRVLRRGGVDIRKGRAKRAFSESERQEMIRLAEAGISQVAIGQRLGVHQTTVSARLAESGVRVRRYVARGEHHGSWKGGIVRSSSGYAMVMVPHDSPFLSMASIGGYVMQHRLVMAQKLGRPLTAHETVHHINGDRTDNRPENLQLRNGRHGKGAVFVCADCGSPNIVEHAVKGGGTHGPVL